MRSSPSIPRTPKPVHAKSENLHAYTGTARFTFENGGSYEGGYRVDVDRRTLVKQDEGVYVTDNLDVYSGKWCDDKCAEDEFHIRYNNGAQYKGELDADGAMSGMGTYIFPDGSSLTARWSRNRPVSDVVYRQSLGHAWATASISDNCVTFITGNHFWNEIRETSLEGSSSI
ncbi:uncharacterized protein LOC105286230 isoform X2 [Ooceraea biroi]|uniref:uncharacterized protein LOC105286230 isoform X2 n=1 Tax=Ooceraea biroi TaxID=2015173 RepID=UPI0005B7C63B|nr:uncharacterized protein LOC105286230 isoform X2 [Ooceraea biroi]